MKIQFLFLFMLLYGWIYAQGPPRRAYVCYMKTGEIKLDGRLVEPTWKAVPWSENFTDIEGFKKPVPLHETRMKILWDEEFLYIGVHLVEPQVWATFTERESVIFQENDIEVFLDPDGDTHNYYELEINALGTEWDLLLTKPYRNGGRAINGWNINGFQKAIHIEGTLNNPYDMDQYWSIEMAIPWKSLSQAGPSYHVPRDGEQWRINFSRVQWEIESENGVYRKKMDPATNKPFSEYNWVWSPMGMIDMHLPHRWGFLQFAAVQAGKKTVEFSEHPDESVKDGLRAMYELQNIYFKKHQKYASTWHELGQENVKRHDFGFETSATRYKISAPSKVDRGIWYITEDSRVWKD